MRRITTALVVGLLLCGFVTQGQAGEVAFLHGDSSWCAKAAADAQTQIAIDKLNAWGVVSTWFATTAEDGDLADWVVGMTGNGDVDVLVLYGVLPPALYPTSGAQTDGSVAEAFIESTDGDTIINFADWMFYVSTLTAGVTTNGPAGLQSMMDNPTITMDPGAAGQHIMLQTAQGRSITPSLPPVL